MTEEQPDTKALANVLKKAKLHLDEAVGNLQSGGELGGAISRELRSTDDNNSGCNTGCACGTTIPV